MSSQNVGDVIQVTYAGLWHNQQVQNILKFGVATITGTVTTGAMASGINTAMGLTGSWYAKFLACCPPQYFLNNVYIQTIAPTRVVRSIFSVVSSGTYSQASSTANLASVVTKYGALAKKTNRGSIHVPTSNLDDEMSNGSISSGLLTALNGLASLFNSTLTVSGLGTIVPVLLKSKGLTTDAIPILAAIPQLTVRTMRSRTVGHGK